MKNDNQVFFEEYKRLDKLIKEVLNSEVGVTAYIDEMKAVSNYERNYLRGFEHTLKRLIEVRHIRNKLAHDTINFDTPLCDEADIKFIREFKKSILNQTDPLCFIYKMRRSKRKSVTTPLNKTSNNSFENTNGGCLKGIGAFIVFVVLFILSILVANLIKG